MLLRNIFRSIPFFAILVVAFASLITLEVKDFTVKYLVYKHPMHSAPLKVHNYFGIKVLALMLLSLRYCESMHTQIGSEDTSEGKGALFMKNICSYSYCSHNSTHATRNLQWRLLPLNSLTVMHLYCMAAFCNIRCSSQIRVRTNPSSHSLQYMNRAELCVCTCNHCYLAGSSDENYIRHWIQDVTKLGYR